MQKIPQQQLYEYVYKCSRGGPPRRGLNIYDPRSCKTRERNSAYKQKSRNFATAPRARAKGRDGVGVYTRECYRVNVRAHSRRVLHSARDLRFDFLHVAVGRGSTKFKSDVIATAECQKQLARASSKARSFYGLFFISRDV